MGLNSALDISVSAINAERLHMELIASNIANINTTKTVDGGIYRRKVLSYTEKPVTFEDVLAGAQKKAEIKTGGGVDVSVTEDMSAPMQKIFNPGHPDADEKGYVTLPNVSLSTEMTDLIFAGRLYETNVTVFSATKKMQTEALQIQ
ncbi:MAG: flagellar basal body rod protein FlgC [Candidatus Saganbacteria bacterium]|nr:flagellar basal body rod protein FlgC [Candidatus Saganbacteria bacterium]